MQRLLAASALALTVGLAVVPAAAQSSSGGASSGGGASTVAPPSTRAAPPPGAPPAAAPPSTRALPPAGAPPTAAQPAPSQPPAVPPSLDGSLATGGSPSTRSDSGGDRFLDDPPSSERFDNGIRSGGGRLRAELQRCVAKHRALDHDSDGELAATELDSIRRVVKDVDRNHDEKIDSAEIRSACASGLLTDRELPKESSKKEHEGG
jgi:hypothetical protein